MINAKSQNVPFLRWAGGKNWLIKHLDLIIGDLQYNNYHEPFLGGASVFFSLNCKNTSYLSDINEELINTYLSIKENPNDVIEILKTYENTEAFYYSIRNAQPETLVQQAARFIYLNQTSFNGLYRVNKSGIYNVPYGFRTTSFYNSSIIMRASESLKNANITCNDFFSNSAYIKEKDLIFLDPPYTVSHNDNGFIKYNKNLFALEDQYRLSNYINTIKEKGAYYILTNAAHEKILEIFDKGDRIIELERSSLIGGRNSKRGLISEYIFTNI